jgi:hypothetical protein
MKATLLIVLFATAALCQQKTRFGQTSTSPWPAACGPAQESFKVKLDDSQHTLLPPENGTARIYFIHEAGLPYIRLSLGYPTSKFAIDGTWMGADHGDSYFSASLAPGEHHVCATLQSSIVDDRVELTHFVAEAGKVYYYRTRLVLSGSVELLELDAIDSDQGEYLVRQYPLSISKPKK